MACYARVAQLAERLFRKQEVPSVRSRPRALKQRRRNVTLMQARMALEAIEVARVTGWPIYVLLGYFELKEAELKEAERS